jgi:inorganic phosphate transporter, PiT family
MHCGLVGAGLARAGTHVILWNGLRRTAAAFVLSPMTGLALAPLLVLMVSWSFVRAAPAHTDGVFRKMQFVSGPIYSLGHGGNEAQKTMSIIAALLAAQDQLPGAFHSCNGDMALGMLLGGWRLVRPRGSPCRASARRRQDR